jgi:hypothetical protein
MALRFSEIIFHQAKRPSMEKWIPRKQTRAMKAELLVVEVLAPNFRVARCSGAVADFLALNAVVSFG